MKDGKGTRRARPTARLTAAYTKITKATKDHEADHVVWLRELAGLCDLCVTKSARSSSTDLA
jgi:hypothetical protein